MNCIFSFVIVILDSNSCKLQKMFGKVADVKPQVDPQVGGEPVDWHILALAITDIVGSFYSLFLFLCKWLKIHSLESSVFLTLKGYFIKLGLYGVY